MKELVTSKTDDDGSSNRSTLTISYMHSHLISSTAPQAGWLYEMLKNTTGASFGGQFRAATEDWAGSYRADGALTSHCVTTPAPPPAPPRATSCARTSSKNLPPTTYQRPRPPSLVTFHNSHVDNQLRVTHSLSD
ncbi:unnamed protein product [Danaus chrysippus]|uniref:(African queen) hypothetical protein n=1 Tax=Danaus chrysippus TaxID=151541 RepID=A0A8J2W308_9NEOP|nr:unnamed protein product [Danaus chrysippus]